jgi:hypothetical protein
MLTFGFLPPTQRVTISPRDFLPKLSAEAFCRSLLATLSREAPSSVSAANTPDPFNARSALVLW